jgi:hypothetical protein
MVMDMSGHLNLPIDLYSRLLKVAAETGRTPTEWIESQLPTTATNGQNIEKFGASSQDVTNANARLEEFIVSLGYPTGVENERIDADLVREYGIDHSGLYQRKLLY